MYEALAGRRSTRLRPETSMRSLEVTLAANRLERTRSLIWNAEARRRYFDVWEFLRFLVSGGTSASTNMTVFWLMRFHHSFQFSLLTGSAAGLTLSFLLSKLFAFVSRSWRRTGGEVVRFLLIYSLGLSIYWSAATLTRHILTGIGVSAVVAEWVGILAGSGCMMLTSYLGHRLFTYRKQQRVADF